MRRGFIKLWRKCRYNPLMKDHKTFTVWIYLLLNAAHKPISVMVGDTTIRLDVGEFAFSVRELAKDLNLSYQQTRTALKKLESNAQITQRSTQRATIVSIVNWNRYQPKIKKHNAPGTRKSTHSQRTYTDLEEYKEGEEANPPVDPQILGVIQWIEKKEMEENQ